MKGRLLVLVALLLALSCARLPKIVPVTGADPSGPAEGCNRIFPAGKWQLLHSIEADLPGGRNSVMMGLTVLSSRLRSNRSVIMSLEGFVVFDGEFNQGLKVHRALPPFDSPGFAEGLMEDIRLIFFKPEGPAAECGILTDGSTVCRYKNPDGGVVDIVFRSTGTCEALRYDRKQRLTRIVRIPVDARSAAGLPQTIELTAQGKQAYKLVMTLLEAVPLDP
ncbi:MAG: hypothetical protein P8Y74_02250 [Desulfobacterales bacterium]